MNHEFWYLSRAAGFTAYLTLFASIALGMMLSTRAAQRTGRQQVIFDMHRFLSILAVAFSLFHVYILLGDQYLHFSVWQLSVPFTSPYRSLAVAAGVASMYGLLLVTASFYVRRFIGYRAWRALHFITFLMYAGVTLHGITAGTDTTQPWARWIYASTGIAVLALLAYRLRYRLPQSETWRRARLAAAGAAAVFALTVVYGTGLFAPANAAQTTVQDTPAAAVLAADGTFLPAFSGTVSGTFTQTADSKASQLSMRAQVAGDLPAKLNIDLATQRATEDGQAQVSLNKVQLLDTASNALICDGKVTAFDGGSATLVCNGAGPYAGLRIAIHATFAATDEATITGDVSGEMTRLS